jgi:DNA-binding protein YbaB
LHRVRLLRDTPYSQAEADAGAGLVRVDNGGRGQPKAMDMDDVVENESKLEMIEPKTVDEFDGIE